MDKAVIVGVYEFIGFHLCLSLLEKGVEVKGIHLPAGENELFLEEKRLSIGRNSNFIEEDLSSLQSFREEEGNAFYFIDFYSFYMKRKEHIIMDMIDQITQEEHKPQMAIILPIQLCEEREKSKDQSLLNVINESQVFYLPTIYGPWQPLYFYFQQAIIHPQSTIQINDREYMEDAIYVGDTISTILKQIEKGEHNPFLLKSNIANHWNKVIGILQDKEPAVRKRPMVSIKQDVTSLPINSIPIVEGIEKQKIHLATLGII